MCKSSSIASNSGIPKRSLNIFFLSEKVSFPLKEEKNNKIVC